MIFHCFDPTSRQASWGHTVKEHQAIRAYVFQGTAFGLDTLHSYVSMLTNFHCFDPTSHQASWGHTVKEHQAIRAYLFQSTAFGLDTLHSYVSTLTTFD